MIKSIFTNSFGILFSRILGFIRDMLQASILGANIYTDIFIVAFKLPNLFRRIFAEGAFTQSFLPAFSASRQKGLFSASIFTKFIGFLLLFSLFVTLFSNFFTQLIATGFSQESIKEAAPLVAINFYYLILIFIVTFLAALLQYKNHFATTAFSTALLNIALIFALLYSQDMDKKSIIYHMSYAVIIGGLMQVFVHIIMIKKLHLHKFLLGGFWALKKKKNMIASEIETFKGKFIASTLGSSTAQISAFLDGWLASFLISGSISYLYYANRIFQFPLALFAIATSVAIFPKVARYLKNEEFSKAHTILRKSFWFLAAILTIATLIGILLSKEIVWLLYERDSFTSHDTQHTAIILSMYLIGLIPYGLSRIFSLWLYSTHRQKEAAKISAITLGTNILLSLALVMPLHAAGLALASSLSGFILLFLTIRAFGLQAFFDIIELKYIAYLTIGAILLTIMIVQLKDYFSATLQ
jgi:putative peptidoglycan lipid II flippase